jgi:hypothetical protein
MARKNDVFLRAGTSKSTKNTPETSRKRNVRSVLGTHGETPAPRFADKFFSADVRFVGYR